METETRWIDAGVHSYVHGSRGKCTMDLQEAFRLRYFLFPRLVHPQLSWTAPAWTPTSEQVIRTIEIIFLFDFCWVTGSIKSWEFMSCTPKTRIWVLALSDHTISLGVFPC